MSDDFHDKLAFLCAPEIAAAMKSEDTDRAADMITALAEMLGKTIARATNGNPAGIDTMLIGAEQVIAETAADMAGVIAMVRQLKSEDHP